MKTKDNQELREPTDFDENWKEMTGNKSINPSMGLSSNTLCRKDKSWGSVPDFFIKLFRGKK